MIAHTHVAVIIVTMTALAVSDAKSTERFSGVRG